jgi:hypothetical protein
MWVFILSQRSWYARPGQSAIALPGGIEHGAWGRIAKLGTRPQGGSPKDNFELRMWDVRCGILDFALCLVP